MNTSKIVLRNAILVDGSGEAARPADVAVEGDSIAAVGDGLRGYREIDCSDLVIAPGFIDTHSHSDLRVFTEPLLPMKIRQGITLEVLGQDGISVAPVRPKDIGDTRRALSGLLGDLPEEEWRWEKVRDYLKSLEEAKPVLNLAYLVPHGTLRTYVMGRENRKPTPAELEKMSAELARGLEEGALGMSTGLIYPPCCYADTDELVAMGQVLAPRRAPMVAHMRSESDLIERAIDEMVEVGLRSRCPVQHLSSENCRARELLSGNGDRRAHRRSPRSRRIRHRRSVLLRRRLDAPGRDSATLGARRGTREDTRKTSRSDLPGEVAPRHREEGPSRTGIPFGSGRARRASLSAASPAADIPSCSGRTSPRRRNKPGRSHWNSPSICWKAKHWGSA